MRKNRKGFTLVELVIVIAVIAILSAVLLPTFAGILERARESSRIQRVTSIRNEYLAKEYDSIEALNGYIISIDNHNYVIGENGELTKYIGTIEEYFGVEESTLTAVQFENALIYPPMTQNTTSGEGYAYNTLENKITWEEMISIGLVTVEDTKLTAVNNTLAKDYPNIVIDSSITEIYTTLDEMMMDPSGGFSWCSNIKSIVIPSSVETLNYGTFYYCTSLESVEFLAGETGVKELPECAFYYCQELKNVVLPNNLEIIGRDCFACCVNITEIELPETIKELKFEAFYECSFETIVLPDSLTTIEDSAFSTCGNLKYVILPNNIEKVTSFMFSYCYSLEYIVLPKSVKNVGYGFLYCCDAFSTIYYTGTAEEWDEIEIGTMYNTPFTNATVYYYSETSQENTWHYENGLPVVW